jgi:hypothetical protein
MTHWKAEGRTDGLNLLSLKNKRYEAFKFIYFIGVLSSLGDY